MNSFTESMQEIEQVNIKYTLENFNIFVNDVKQKVNDHFLINEKDVKKSKRTLLSNPWITPGLIASVSKKH